MEVSTFAGPATDDGSSRKRVQITIPTGHLQMDLQQWRWLAAISMALDDNCEPVPGMLDELHE